MQKPLQGKPKAKPQFGVFLSSAFSVLVGLGFAVFNLVLGILFQSAWNYSISVYYCLLAIIRAIVVFSRLKPRFLNPNRDRKTFIKTHALLFVLDLALVGPIALMVLGERSYSFGLIPAIGMATYTTYRVVAAAVYFGRSRHQENLLVKELRLINLQDALVAALSLQNTLIIATGSTAESMMQLTMWTSGAIWLLIVVSTLVSLIVGLRKSR